MASAFRCGCGSAFRGRSRSATSRCATRTTRRSRSSRIRRRSTPESRRALEHALAEAGFVLEVMRVLAIEEEVEIRQWTVETKHGPRSFQTHLDDWPRALPDGRAADPRRGGRPVSARGARESWIGGAGSCCGRSWIRIRVAQGRSGCSGTQDQFHLRITRGPLSTLTPQGLGLTWMFPDITGHVRASSAGQICS